MSVPISNVSRRVVLTASGTGPYSFNFEILANTDISVYRDDTLLTLTTDYTVTINTNGTGYVTLTATPTGATQIAIVGDRAIQRTTDFTTGGDLFATSLNDELDSLTIFAQQNAEAVGRALKAPQTDPTTIDMTLPRATVRANKTLAFDSSGNPTTGEQIGDWRGNWAAGTSYAKRDLIKDTTNSNVYICVVAHTSSGSLPITTNADSAKWALVVDAAAADASADLAEEWASKTNGQVASTDYSAKAWSVGGTGVTDTASRGAAKEWAIKTSGTVDGTNYSAKYHADAAATSASNASTSASNASTSASNASSSATAAQSAQTAAESARDSTLAAFDSFDDRYLGTKTSDPTVDNDGNPLVAGALYFNSTAGIMKVYTGSAWVAAYVSAAGLLSAANNLSDVASTATSRTNLGLGTGDSPQFTAVNIGNASDTTVTRASAGVIAVEGSSVLMASNIGGSVQAYDADTAKTDVVQTFTAAQTFNSGNLKLAGSTSGAATLNAPAIAGTNTYALPPDASTLGYRNVPQSGSDKTTSYTLATTDIGEFVGVGTSGSITIPNSTFAAGDVISIFNNTSGNITITCSITTAYIAGTNTDKDTMTLATRGVATILFISGTVCVVTGNVS
jgi:hypothetical protein